MIFSLGVYAFIIWRAAAPWLIVSTPVVWIFAGRRVLVIHLTLIAIYAAVFFGVSTQTRIPPSGDHNVYVTFTRYYFALPVSIIDAIIIFARARADETGSSMRDLMFIAGLAMAFLVVASWATSVWLLTIPSILSARARAAAGPRPFCLDVGFRQVENPSQLTMADMLDHAFRSGVEYHSYYAVLNVEGETSARNWSFRSGSFQPQASSSFPTHCTPVSGRHNG